MKAIISVIVILLCFNAQVLANEYCSQYQLNSIIELRLLDISPQAVRSALSSQNSLNIVTDSVVEYVYRYPVPETEKQKETFIKIVLEYWKHHCND